MKSFVPLVIANLWIATAHGMPVENVPYAETRPRLDASSEDRAWIAAAVIQALPLSTGPEAEGLKPSPTEVRLLWDENYFYARFTCLDTQIESPFPGRDQPHYQGDVVEVFLDPNSDGRRYVELQVSPDNQIFDQLIELAAAPSSDGAGQLTDEFLAHHFRMDKEWELKGLRSATRRIEGGWIADIAIPAAPFNLERWQPMSLRAHLMRYDWLPASAGEKRRLIAMNWAPVRYGCPHISPEVMGRLQLLPRK